MVQIQQCRPECGVESEEVAGKELGLCMTQINKDGINAVQAGSRHQPDIKLL
jgi:hypothetical protein